MSFYRSLRNSMGDRQGRSCGA